MCVTHSTEDKPPVFVLTDFGTGNRDVSTLYLTAGLRGRLQKT